MSEEFNKLNGKEEIKAENEFLKMKMMLEHGADIQFSCTGPPEMENDFLKYIMAFESQRANSICTTVFKKMGSPTHFKKVADIDDADIENQYAALVEYMNEYGVGLDHCSPNISVRELYRFITEELFEKEIADINVPGMMSSFDEFHPDHEYDNTRVAIGECIRYIFSKDPFDFMGQFDRENLQINDHENLSEENFQLVVNRFKELFDEINLIDAEAENCLIEGNDCTVKGRFSVDLLSANNKISIEDSWEVDFFFREDCGYWYITKVRLNGVNL